MAKVREWLQRFWGTLWQNPRDGELEDELRLHLELAAEEALRREPLDDGPRTARLQTGGLAQAMEALRDQRGLPWLTDLARDLGFGWRLLARNRGFAVVAILTLALGIGANTAMFSFVDGVLLKPLPYRNAVRIVRVLEKAPHAPRNGISTLNFLDWQKDNAVFDFMAARTSGLATLTGRGEPIQLRGARVSARYFDIFGIEAERGRTFLPDEDQPGNDHVVVLSHALWVNQFGTDHAIVNRTIGAGACSRSCWDSSPPSPCYWRRSGSTASPRTPSRSGRTKSASARRLARRAWTSFDSSSLAVWC